MNSKTPSLPTLIIVMIVSLIGCIDDNSYGIYCKLDIIRPG